VTKITVIIPNYNNAKYLADCLNSVRRQTYANLEIILIDDQSADDSYKIARKIAAADPRVRVFRMPKNGGVGAARNLGLDKATGEFVVFLDSDDLMPPTAVEGLFVIQRSLDADIVSGQFTDVPENFTIPADAKFPPPAFGFDFTAKNYEFVNRLGHICVCVVWGKLIRKTLLDDLRFRTDIYPNEDVEFIMRLFARVKGGAVMHGIATYYRKSATSVINKEYRDNSDDVAKVLESLADFVSVKENGHRHYLEFLRHYTYTFMRVWATNIFGKMLKGGTLYAGPEYHDKFRAQMLKIAKTTRKLLARGHFRGLKIKWYEWLGLRLYAHGFVETGALMFMIRYS
jgi:glycosyltransferase involved in cell wall biosynthesis